MKKKLVLVMVALAFCSIVLVVIGSGRDETLDPAVKEVLAMRLPEVAPEDNAYVGLSGLGHIRDGDVVTAGKKFLSADLQVQADSVQEQDFEFSYRNPCLESHDGNEGCLDQIAADASTLKADVEKNQKIIERYHIVQKMPFFVCTSSNFMDRVPQYQVVLSASKLIGAQALLDIKQGDLSAGLAAIETDLNFYKRMGQSEHGDLISLMIAMAAIRSNLIEISKVIEDGQIDLAGQEDRLRKMLDLNFSPGSIMTTALKTEKWRALQGFDQLADSMLGESSDLKDKRDLFLFKRNMTINQVAAQYDEVIKRVQAAPTLGFPGFLVRDTAEFMEKESSGETSLSIRELYGKYGVFFFKNRTGEIFLNIAQPYYMKYLGRIHDTVVYSRLVRAQLELRIMADRPGDIPAVLAELGPETWNPYTGKPFDWDSEQKCLWAGIGGKLEKESSDWRIIAVVPGV